MDRFVVMVDAGYLLHQSAEIVSERASTKRHHLEVMNPAALVNLLLEKTRTALGLTSRELLRVYWYDGVMASGLSPQQRAIAELPDVHFRSGIVNAAGQQRGVDSLIVTDLIELASNSAISDAALVTGDGDFAIGIEMAQKKGVRIAVIGVEDVELGVSHRQSFEITSRADRVARLNVYDLSAVMRYAPPTSSSAAAGDYEYSQPLSYASGLAGAAAPQTGYSVPPSAAVYPGVRNEHTPLDEESRLQIIESVKVFVEEQAGLCSEIDPTSRRIDAALDRLLIHHIYADLGHGKLTNAEKNFARDRLRAELLNSDD
ncbi:MAG: NYN domain-containing protein [Lautropia sp.]|nr:NYN domain-containing protein [Lautropia sp.]